MSSKNEFAFSSCTHDFGGGKSTPKKEVADGKLRWQYILVGEQRVVARVKRKYKMVIKVKRKGC